MSDSLQPHGPEAARLFCPWGSLQARILQWVAMPSSRGSSRPRDRTHISYIPCIGRRARVLYYLCPLGSPFPGLILQRLEDDISLEDEAQESCILSSQVILTNRQAGICWTRERLEFLPGPKLNVPRNQIPQPHSRHWADSVPSVLMLWGHWEMVLKT